MSVPPNDHPDQGWTPRPPEQPAQPQPQWGQPGYDPKAQHVGPPKKKRRGLIVLGAVVAVIVLFALVSQLGGGTTPTGEPAAPATSAQPAPEPEPGQPTPPPKATPKPTKKPAPAAGVGDPVKNGDFTFTVTKVAPGPKRIGNDYLNHSPQGRFLYVYVNVTNHGDAAALFHDSEVTGYDAKGRTFEADGEASIYLGDESGAFLNEINPGNTVKGIVVFDLPKDVDLTRLVFLVDVLSDGAAVAL